jgi:beta-exotoxin I transport system permease protein
MLRNVFGKTLWDQRRGIVIWALAVAAVGVLYAAFWPTMDTPELQKFLEAYPKGVMDALGFTDITSPAGYLGATTYGLLGPVLIIIYGAMFGARAIAGEEEAGRLEVLLAHPVERWQVVIQRAAAMVVALALAGAALWAAMLAAAGPAQFSEIGADRLAAASTQLVLLGLLFGTLALLIGAATGKRAIALGVVGGLAVAAYLANNLAPSVAAIAGAQKLSPFYYYNEGRPLVNGWQLVDGLLLLGVSVAFIALAALLFRRRDVAV